MIQLTKSFLTKFTLLSLFLVTTLSSGAFAQKQANIYNVGYGLYNSFLLEEDGKLLLIDSGLPSKIKKLEENIRKLGFSPKDVRWMILTHIHTDHVGAAAWFQKEYGTQIIMHRNGREMAEKGTFDSLKIVSPNKMMGNFAYKQVVWEFPAFSPDIVVDSTYDLSKEGFNVQIQGVGGHTAGSVVVAQGDRLFVGDLVRGALVSRHKPRIHFFAKDQTKVWDILQQLAQQSYSVWYPGHGGAFKPTDIEKFLNKHMNP